MRKIALSIVVTNLILVHALFAQSPPDEKVDVQAAEVLLKVIKDRTQRGTLHDAFQAVRGDTGKWNDEPSLQLAPAIARKPEQVSLDDWFDQLAEQKYRPAGGETWLLFRTRQLDDNDRAWVERVERRGNQFTIVVSLAKWQGKYPKNFTYYDVFGVNLGKLEPGKYEAKWVISPREFRTFDGDGRPRDNWPKDDVVTAEKQAIELPLQFTVAANSP